MSLLQKAIPKALWRKFLRPALSFFLATGVLMGSVSIAVSPPASIYTIFPNALEFMKGTEYDSFGWNGNPGDADGKFTIAILPDTQGETTDVFHRTNLTFRNRMEWIVANKTTQDIRFVGHTGDVENFDTDDHLPYQYGSNAYIPMDTGGIPFAMSLGNHDTAAVYNGGSASEPSNSSLLVRKTTSFNTYYPVSRFPGAITFEPGKIDNNYQTFKACGKKWLVLTLELWARYEVINWAKTVVEEHPDYNVIIQTHAYLTGSTNAGIQGDNGGYGTSKPTEIFDQLVKQYPNIKFVFSGHTGVAGRREDTGVNGNKIVSVLGCFHNGTTNPTQLMEIDVNNNTASTRFYAPYTDQNWDSQYKWTFTGMNFVSPSSDKARLRDLVRLSDMRNSADFTPATWSPLAPALATGRSVLNNTGATQQQITDATNALATAFGNLTYNPPGTAHSWEFKTGGDTQGWTASKMNALTTTNDCLTGEAFHSTDPLDAWIQSPANLQLSPAYSILKFRAKVTNPEYNQFSGGAVYFNRTTDGASLSTARSIPFTVEGNAGFVEYSIDLSINASWNGTIDRLWIEPIRGPNGTKMEIDYIRLQKKGASTLTYNANAGSDTVMGIPMDDTTTADVTGYLPSGQIPVRPGYALLGWSYQPDGEIPLKKFSVSQNTTVYAIWKSEKTVGFSAEFNNQSELNAWIGTAPVKTIEDGVLKLELPRKDTRFQYVITTGDDGKEPLSSEYALMKIRYKKATAAETGVLRWQRIGDDPGTNDVVAAATARRQYSYYFVNQVGNDSWYELTVDLSPFLVWNGDIRSIWIDPCEGATASDTNTTKIEFDYIRFCRKGTNIVTYDKNVTTGNVTGMPESDRMASPGSNYMLSGHKPLLAGYIFKGWALTPDGEPVADNTMELTGDTTVYAVWGEAQPVSATFHAGGATGTVPEPIVTGEGAAIVLPQAGNLTKTNCIFVGWSDGTTTYQPGQSYTLNSDKTFTATWSDEISSPIMGKSWEFNTAGSVEGWTATKASGFTQSNGTMALTTSNSAPYYDTRIASPDDLKLNPAFSILRYRAKINGTLIPNKPGTVYFTRYIDDINGDSVYGITENGTRYINFTQQADNVYVEYTIDLSSQADWNSSAARIWMDPIRCDSGANLNIDYIRLYRKGTHKLYYNANAGAGTVTGMPANDLAASMGLGYLLSGQIPVRTGYTFLGWAATPDGQVIANNTINITEDVTTVYAKWYSLVGDAVASFNADGGTGTVPSDIIVAIGSNITLPAKGDLAKANYVFTGWSDGSATYQPGVTYKMNANKTFTAVWVTETSLPVIGKSWEFNTAGDTEGWSNMQKLTGFGQSGGALVGTSDIPVGTPGGYDSRIQSPNNLLLDPSFSIIKIRAKVNGTPGRTGTVFFTRYIDDINSDSAYGIAENGVRSTAYTVIGGSVYTEYSIDLTTHPSWGSSVARMWLDPLSCPVGESFEIDYIRLYRKGTNALNYNSNGSGVTGMPANDTKVALGTGYMLSGQTPMRSGYVFLGWSATAGGEVIANNMINITGATTNVYAQWRSAVTLTASFEAGVGSTGTPPAPIVTGENMTITLPENTLTKEGYTFLGWADGYSLYPAGGQYTMGVTNVNFKATWQMPTPTFLPENGAEQVDFRNLCIQMVFPVDIDPTTLTPNNIDPILVKSVSYDASTKTASIYLKPEYLFYGAVVNLKGIKNIFSADLSLALPATSYSFSTLTTQPEDGENLVSNGNFELPFISGYGNSVLELSTDTPTGTGKSLKLTEASSYAQIKFNVFIKPGATYLVEFDAKALTNVNGASTNGNGRIQFAYKTYKNPPPTDGSSLFEDKPFGGKTDFTTNLNSGEGWKHVSGYIHNSPSYPNIVPGPGYMFIFSDPFDNVGLNYMIDNVSVKEAYPISFSAGEIPNVTIYGAIANSYQVKGTSYQLPTSGFSADGYTLVGWTDGVSTYDLGEICTVSVGGKNFTAIWEKDGGQVEIGKLGDANGDGNITAFDAVVVLQIVAGLISPTANQTILCNANSDTDVTAFDAVLILQYVAGLATGYPIGEVVYGTPAV